MHSMEFEDEGPSLEHTPFGESSYDFVEQARSAGARLDQLVTPGSMVLGGEGKGNGEELYVNDRMDGDGEKACSIDVDSNCFKSSDGDNEGVRTRQVNKGANGSTR